MILRKSILLLTSAVFSIVLNGCNACTEQHDPRFDRALFKAEEAQANKPERLLNEDGTYPAPVSKKVEKKVASASNPSLEKYNQFCVACHGADGKANGPGAIAMNPRPRNFTDKAWQAKTTDARIIKVLNEGGASLGLSASMAAWKGILTDDEIKGMVGVIRNFGK